MSRDPRSHPTFRVALSRLRLVVVVGAGMAAAGPGINALRAASDPLEAGFKTPPDEANEAASKEVL